MAIDKAVDSAALDTSFTAIAEAIRDKNGGTAKYTPEQMPAAIRAIVSGTPVQSKTGTFTLGAYQSGYFQSATINPGFLPDVIVVYLAEDTWTNNKGAHLNCAAACFLVSEKVHTYIVSDKFSSKVYLETLLQREASSVTVAMMKHAGNSEGAVSAIGTTTVFQYAAYKFT